MKEPSFTAVDRLYLERREREDIQSMGRAHYHDGYEIYIQLEGRRRLVFDDVKFTLRPGAVFIMKPFVLHRTMKEEGFDSCSRILISFPTKGIEDVLGKHVADEFLARLDSCVMQLGQEQLYELCHDFSIMEDYKERSRTGTSKSLDMKLAYMKLCLILDKLSTYRRSLPDTVSLDGRPKGAEVSIARALAYINEHYREDISPEEVIKASNFSRAHFYRLFKGATGSSFAAYVNRIRLSQAHKLMEETSLSLSEIARTVGFSSASQFSRVFRQVHGMSPAEFRRGR